LRVVDIAVCPRLKVVNSTTCHGYCQSGSVRYFSPLATICRVTCNHGNGTPVRTYNFTCVWHNDVTRAAWIPRQLPDAVTTGKFSPSPVTCFCLHHTFVAAPTSRSYFRR